MDRKAYALFLLTIDNKTAFEVIIVVLGGLAASIRAVNYALYCAAVAGAVLIALGLSRPPAGRRGTADPVHLPRRGDDRQAAEYRALLLGRPSGGRGGAVTALKKGRAGVIAVYATSMADRISASASARDKYVSK